MTTHTPATAGRHAPEAGAYFAAVASLRAGDAAARLDAARCLLGLAADPNPSAVRHRARVAIRQHFGAVVEDASPALAAEVATIEAARAAAAEAEADGWQRTGPQVAANDNRSARLPRH